MKSKLPRPNLMDRKKIILLLSLAAISLTQRTLLLLFAFYAADARSIRRSPDYALRENLLPNFLLPELLYFCHALSILPIPVCPYSHNSENSPSQWAFR